MHMGLFPIGHHATKEIRFTHAIDPEMQGARRIGTGGIDVETRRFGIMAAAKLLQRAADNEVAQDLRLLAVAMHSDDLVVPELDAGGLLEGLFKPDRPLGVDHAS